MVYDFGSIPLPPQMVLNSCWHFREAEPEGSGILRACAGVSKEGEGQSGDAPSPSVQQATPGRRLEGSAQVSDTHPHVICCRAACKTQARTCRDHRVFARPGGQAKAWGAPGWGGEGEGSRTDTHVKQEVVRARSLTRSTRWMPSRILVGQLQG